MVNINIILHFIGNSAERSRVWCIYIIIIICIQFVGAGLRLFESISVTQQSIQVDQSDAGVRRGTYAHTLYNRLYHSSSLLLTICLPSPPLRSRPLFAAWVSGGALKLPQLVRAEPGRQTVFGEL